MSSHLSIDTQLRALRHRVPYLMGALVASSDGLVIAHNLPAEIEPSGIAALAATQWSLSVRFIATTHASDLNEVVIEGRGGRAVVYGAGATAVLTVLTDPDAVLARVHLEARPVAREIAELLTSAAATSTT
ncbi:roadblock/LC7 domain-containing protein [Nocardia sp. NPDC057668]|uniref:roadblock/LC7 domain-containing protein n=1 Tax=Nocardia sp. NPDC057668 TaxID=3346202 RepID=UPI003671098C